MADVPLVLPGGLGEQLARVLDVEGKIPRALDALGSLAGRDVVLLDPGAGIRAAQLTALGARIVPIESLPAAATLPAGSADAIVGLWTAFRGVEPADLAGADRLLRPGGHLLVVHDYGRDDVSRIRGDLPEYGLWSRRDGPFLRSGFRIHVVHCWWTFDSLDEARAFLGKAFGPAGEALASELRRPRLSWNVAIYHRERSPAHDREPEPSLGGPGSGPRLQSPG